jgi:AraC family transcriptional regulator
MNTHARVMPRGAYWGGNLAQVDAGCALLTLCAYPAEARFPRHAHVNPGLFLSVQGQHRETDSDRVVEQLPMSVMWHPSDTPHETEFGPEGAVGLNISLDPGWLAESGAEECDLLRSRIERSPVVRAAAARLLVFVTGRGVASIEEELIEIVALGVRDPLVTAPAPWLRQALDILHDEYDRDLSLGALAARVGVHRVHLARCFRGWTRTSVGNYLQMLRLEAALKLAVCGNYTIAAAAAEAGFADQAHLARLARRYWGCSARELLSILRQNVPIVQG